MFTITPQDSEQYIMIDDCCIKQTVKKNAIWLMHKPVTDVEALLLCIYYFLFTMLICGSIMQYRVAAQLSEWSVGESVSPKVLIHINLFVNVTIIVQMIENTKELVCAFVCKCDYRQHPELEDLRD